MDCRLKFARHRYHGWMLVKVISLLCLAPLSSVHAQQADSAVRAARPVPSLSSATDTLDSSPPVQLGGGCNAVRAVGLGLGSYLGYLIGELGSLPLVFADAPRTAIVGVEALGAVVGALWIADLPLSRPLPLCPSTLRTLSGRPTNHVAACRGSQILSGALGAAGGALIAVVAALPLVLTNQAHGTVSVLIIALPAAGAVSSALAAGRRPPCRASLTQ